ncbi:4'-phosphopantetheinyl transferase superfamily protein [Vibrio sp. Of7-15]|uniref:4'-phosphopantetheinyl transferase family protein n=1 Tax=Vibrio sp. Of7-15 TaxID=2724879 RepID=UPI001EF265D6|nr:4'-phosphopantetheinyl transferase superfamily protein [Vibrio sp. Of7-15]MCG7497289.1 4'-phosphopantetheinyl transferase superfamily protein [Vibrio sp. Of7-15]
MNSVQLWFASLLFTERDLAQLESRRWWLSDDELVKVERYRKAEDRQKALFVRCCLRAVLSHYFPLPPNEWKFEYGDKGKPRLCHTQRLSSGIEFNISHSGEHLVIAVMKKNHADDVIELGVDIERSRSDIQIASILPHHFTLFEHSELQALPSEQQRQRFFDLWVLKESYIKAKGLGLALSLKSFGFDLVSMVPEHLLVEGSDIYLECYRGIQLQLLAPSQDGSEWNVFFGRIDDHYRFAVSLNGVGGIISMEARLFELWSSPFG